MKLLIVPETIVASMILHLRKKGTLDEYQIFIVLDEDYEEAMHIYAERIPNDNRLEILEVLYDAD